MATIERVRRQCTMEDVLEVYAREYEEGTVLICLDGDLEAADEGDADAAAGASRPGRPAMILNTSAMVPQTCSCSMHRQVADAIACVTNRRTRQDFARVLKDLADIRFPERNIVLVIDNLNTHKLSSLYETFAPEEASRLAGRLNVHHTSKHGSWPTMAEIEISVLCRQCLDRRIPDRETMRREVGAWQEHRNASAKPVDWRFRTEYARTKLKSLYSPSQ